MSSGPAPPMDLSPAGLAAQARELMWPWYWPLSGEEIEAKFLPLLEAVRDAARAERAEEVRQLREALRQARGHMLINVAGDVESSYFICVVCRRHDCPVIAATEPSHG